MHPVTYGFAWSRDDAVGRGAADSGDAGALMRSELSRSVSCGSLTTLLRTAGPVRVDAVVVAGPDTPDPTDIDDTARDVRTQRCEAWRGTRPIDIPRRARRARIPIVV
jgi:hypothetical protein